jgi:hypothetical protein
MGPEDRGCGAGAGAGELAFAVALALAGAGAGAPEEVVVVLAMVSSAAVEAREATCAEGAGGDEVARGGGEKSAATLSLFC